MPLQGLLQRAQHGWVDSTGADSTGPGGGMLHGPSAIWHAICWRQWAARANMHLDSFNPLRRKLVRLWPIGPTLGFRQERTSSLKVPHNLYYGFVCSSQLVDDSSVVP